MKKQILFLILVCITILIGCSNKENFENFFSTTMSKMHKGEPNYSYSLIYKDFNVVHENDAVAVFTENKQQKETIYIAYFENENGKWNWRQTRGAEWDSPIKWSSMNQAPYIYSGAISDKSISEIYAGNKPAKIIEIEGKKRFWYAVSDTKDVQVESIKSDGTKEVLKQTEDGWIKKEY